MASCDYEIARKRAESSDESIFLDDPPPHDLALDAYSPRCCGT